MGPGAVGPEADHLEPHGRIDAGQPGARARQQGLVVVRLATDGREVWRAADPLFGGGVDDVTALVDGSVVVTGTQWRDYGNVPTLGDQDVFVARYAADGNPMWARTYGGADYDGAAAVAEIDGKLVISGVTDSPRFEGPVADGGGFLLTLDGAGNRRAVSIFDVYPHDMAVEGRRIYVAGDVHPVDPESPEDAVVMRVR